MPLAAGLEDQIPGLGDELLVAQQRPQAALEHVAVLVLAGMVVQRAGEDVGGQGVLDDREPAGGVGAVDHEPVGAELRRPRNLPVLGAQYTRTRGGFLAGVHRCFLPVGWAASTLRPDGKAAHSRKVVFAAPQAARTVLP